jgi:hypothetical protein
MGSVPKLRHLDDIRAQRPGDPRWREFLRLVVQLEDWHADSVRARAYDGAGGSGTREHSHAILRVNRYPGPDWHRLWREAHDVPGAQQAIIDSLRAELHGITHSPSQASPASGLHAGTQEWRLAIAHSEGSLRAVARRFGISHTEVRRIRLQEVS